MSEPVIGHVGALHKLMDDHGVTAEQAWKYLEAQSAYAGLSNEVYETLHHDGRSYLPPVREVETLCDIARVVSDTELNTRALQLGDQYRRQARSFVVLPYPPVLAADAQPAPGSSQTPALFDYNEFLATYLGEVGGIAADDFLAIRVTSILDGQTPFFTVDGEQLSLDELDVPEYLLTETPQGEEHTPWAVDDASHLIDRIRREPLMTERLYLTPVDTDQTEYRQRALAAVMRYSSDDQPPVDRVRDTIDHLQTEYAIATSFGTEGGRQHEIQRTFEAVQESQEWLERMLGE